MSEVLTHLLLQSSCDKEPLKSHWLYIAIVKTQQKHFVPANNVITFLRLGNIDGIQHNRGQ